MFATLWSLLFGSGGEVGGEVCGNVISFVVELVSIIIIKDEMKARRTRRNVHVAY